MRPPCEVVVRYVLPAIRSLLAKELIEKHNLSQVETARKLGTTQAAISHYRYSKRGRASARQLEEIERIQNFASEMAEAIVDENLSQDDVVLKLCRLCEALRMQDAICDIHRDHASLPKNCSLCVRI